MITVTGLSKRYGKKTAVEDLSFTVPDGLVTGFLGPNGSGKSTTMRCMLGLDRPTSGHIEFNGQLSGRHYAGRFAALPDKARVAGSILDATWFESGRSARSHLRVVAAGAGISDKRADECLELVGLAGAASRRAGGFSLGMKQRLGLATALLGDPQHIIMDEPVNGLDPEGMSWMRQMVRALAEQGRAVLISSHLLSEMQLTADRLVVIGKGKLIGEYTMEEFLAHGHRVVVRSPQAVLLADSLAKRGFRVEKQLPNLLQVQVPEGEADADVCTLIAQVALSEGLLVTELRGEADNLEQRFLATTAGAQEYGALNSTAQHAGSQAINASA